MTYSAGSTIVASDYNGFVTNNASANVTGVWATGSTDAGWGQTSNVSATAAAAATVTATQWANLVNTITAMGAQTGTTITSRTAPAAGNTITIFTNLNTDLTNIYANRGNAVASGTTSSTWTGSIAKTSATGSGAATWTITWTQTVTFADANSARYFWNAGGLVRLDMSKTGNVTDTDPDWNTFVGTVGTFYLSGRVNGANQTIASTTYTGFTRSGGSGTPSPNLTTTGWYTLTPGAAATTMMTLTNTTAPYTNETITITAAVNAGSTVLTLVTTWTDGGTSGAGKTRNISGGTDTTSPYTTFGTAPAVLCRFVPPSTTYLTASWGTPAVASTVV
jgi:hypothetical protein